MARNDSTQLLAPENDAITSLKHIILRWKVNHILIDAYSVIFNYNLLHVLHIWIDHDIYNLKIK